MERISGAGISTRLINDCWEGLGLEISNYEDMARAKMALDEKRHEAALYILHYAEYLKAYREKKAEHMAKKKDGGGAHSSEPGKPTETEAIASAIYDESHEEYYWLKSVEIVRRGLSERKRLFVDIRANAEKAKGHIFPSGRKTWVPYVQKKYSEILEKRFSEKGRWLSYNVLNKWWQEIVNRVVMIFDCVNV